MTKKILVVDDDEAILEVVKIVLESEGYEVRTSLSGSFLYTLTHDLPDLIILDVLLSGEDGRSICHHLKTNPFTKNIPVVLFSAHSKEEMSKVFELCQPDYFLPKPFDIQTLTGTIGGLLTKQQVVE